METESLARDAADTGFRKKGARKKAYSFVGLFFCSIVDEAVAAVADVQGGNGEEKKNEKREHENEDFFVSFQ